MNKQCFRETHPNPSRFNIASSIPLHTFKTVADAYQGYHQVALDKSSAKLTTFITEYGRYRYLRSPQGLLSSGDAYSSRLGEILVDVPRLNRLVNDTLMHDPTIEESFHHTFKFLNTCAKHSVTLNPQKFKFCRKEVDFAGYTLAWDKFFPSNETLSAIDSWHGLCDKSLSFYIWKGDVR